MKTAKKWLASLLAIIMVSTALPSIAFAAEATSYDDIYFMFGLVSYMDSEVPYFYPSEQVSDSVAHSYATSGGGSRFDDYYDENTQRYTMTYDQYIAVIDSLFVNHSDMKTYLSETPGYYVQNEDGTFTPVNCYDPDTDSVSFVTGGAGDAWAFEVLNAYTTHENHIYVEGVYVDCSENITDGEAYIDYYPVTQSDGTVTNGKVVATPLLMLQNVNGSLKIEGYSYTGFYVVDNVMYKDGNKGYPITTEYYEYIPETGASVPSDSAGVYFDSSGGGFSDRVWYGDTVWLDISADRYINPETSPSFDIFKVTYGATGADDSTFSQLPVVEVMGQDSVHLHHRSDAIQVTAPMTIKIYKQHAHQYGTDWQLDETGHWHVCSLCGGKVEEATHTYGEWTVTKEATETTKGEKIRTCSVCGYIETAESPTIVPDDKPAVGTDIETKIVQVELTEVPEGLKGTSFNSVEAIETELTRIAVTHTGYTAENTIVSDVKLQFTTDDGATWIDATEENFPSSGITIVLPYPEGTGKDTHDFVVTHMFTATSERLGTTAGDTETPTVKKLDNGIQVTLKGLSPVSISWKEVSTSTDTPDSSTTSPQTGDSSNMALWFALMAVSILGIGATILFGRKRRASR